ncbi:MAG: hypothetical protein LBG15_14575 [Dysgonamonadaceae bacterium]|nr:hypothetical protein [Dysgonamonadaceae bacterium]
MSVENTDLSCLSLSRQGQNMIRWMLSTHSVPDGTGDGENKPRFLPTCCP